MKSSTVETMQTETRRDLVDIAALDDDVDQASADRLDQLLKR